MVTRNRQPVHVVYGGAQLFKPDTCKKLGTLAERSLADFAPDAASLADILEMPPALADAVYAGVVAKLRREPVEDYRIDFEDGFGVRTDAEEDAAVDQAVANLAVSMEAGTLPPFIGFRIKSFASETRPRAFRTLNRFLESAKTLPADFVVTLPKITSAEEVARFMDAVSPYPGAGVELMIETAYSLMNLPKLIELTEGRCRGAHFGPYDYTSSLGITAAHQHLLHPACNFARSTMLVALAGTGIALSDGPTNVLPVPMHRGNALTGSQIEENRAAIHGAWRLHYQHVRDALLNGFYEGWDLHPAQIPIRYAAVYAFFLESLDAASERLRNFIAVAAKATLVGTVFDDAATGQGLLNYFLRALSCGAVEESSIPALTGLTVDQLRMGSFAKILGTL